MKMFAGGKHEGVFLSAADSQPLSAPREELMSQFRAGQLPAVRVAARVYLTGPNKNHTVIPDLELEAFAASFIDKPFMRDHDYTQLAVGGRVIESGVVEADGRKVIRQVLEAVKPWAVESLLDQTIQRFSIGWDCERQVCTSCEEDFFSKKCGHAFSDLGKVDAETKKVVLIRTEINEGIETSAVVHPAVPGTGIEALRKLKAEILSDMKPEEKTKRGGGGQMKEQFAKLLNLPAETEEAEILKAAELRFAVPSVPVAMVKALGLKPEATENEAIAEVVRITAPDTFVKKEDHEKVVTELTQFKAEKRVEAALAAGKIAPANREWAMQQALGNPEGFDVWAKGAPRITALGVIPPVVVTQDAATPTAEVSDVAELMGCTKEMLEKADAAERDRKKKEGK